MYDEHSQTTAQSQVMGEARMNELMEKANNDTLTPEEELELLTELNNGIDQLRKIISTLPDAPVSEDSQS